MGIEQTDKLDFVAVEKATGRITLVLVDAMSWDNDTMDRHTELLQGKLQSYVSFVETGQIANLHPDYIERGYHIEIRARFRYPDFILNALKDLSTQSGIQIDVVGP